MTRITTTTEIERLKDAHRATWAAGDYAAVGTRLLLTDELLCEAVDLRAGERVLDVACGHGNAALAASRRFLPSVASTWSKRFCILARVWASSAPNGSSISRTCGSTA